MEKERERERNEGWGGYVDLLNIFGSRADQVDKGRFLEFGQEMVSSNPSSLPTGEKRNGETWEGAVMMGKRERGNVFVLFFPGSGEKVKERTTIFCRSVLSVCLSVFHLGI